MLTADLHVKIAEELVTVALLVGDDLAKEFGLPSSTVTGT
jgi:hypothetical protein